MRRALVSFALLIVACSAQEQRGRVWVLGLDGATLELAGPMMQAFVNAVQTGEPAIDYDEMLQVIAILDATRTRAAQGRQVSISDIR